MEELFITLNDRQRRNFEAKIDKSGGQDACWPWTGCRGDRDYGMFAVNRHLRTAHRIAYAIWNSQFPSELKVCHECDNPRCCNPSHLWLGTQANNVADMDIKGRRNMAKGQASGSCRHPEKRPRGSRNTSAKITESDIPLIIDMYVPGMVTLEAVGRRFGLTKATVGKIVRRKLWKHVVVEPATSDLVLE